MKKIIAISALALSGCLASTPKNQFNVSNYNLQALERNPGIQEMRIFTTKTAKCAFEKTPEAAAAVSIALAFAAEQTIKYVSARLEEKANYLKSDLTLTAQTGFTSPWPSDDAALEGEISGSPENLCIMLVAGEFISSSPVGSDQPLDIEGDGNKISTQLAAEIYGGDTEISSKRLPVLEDYSAVRPGFSSIDGSPFYGLRGQPSLVAEFRVTSGKSNGKVISIISPTLLLYPTPLHIGAVNGPARPFRITFGVDGSETTLVLDNFKSGGIYSTDVMRSAMAKLVTDADKKFTTLNVTVTEGPDGMPTAQVLEGIAAKKDDITKYAIDKLSELAKSKGEAATAGSQ